MSVIPGVLYMRNISHLTYTRNWHKFDTNRVLLTLFSAPLESSRSPDSTAIYRRREKMPKSNVSKSRQGDEVVNLYIHERREGDVAVLDLRGRIRISGGTLALHRSIRCLVEEGKMKILLNLAGVTHIDSTGLGEFITSYITLSNKGGQLKLVHLTERLQDIMTITKLLPVFDVYDNEEDALASFKSHVSSIVEPQSMFM